QQQHGEHVSQEYIAAHALFERAQAGEGRQVPGRHAKAIEGRDHQQRQNDLRDLHRLVAEFFVQQYAQQHHRQDDRRGELVEFAVQHVTEEERHCRHDDNIWQQRRQAANAFGYSFAEWRNAGRFATIELRHDEEHDQAENENLRTRAEQLRSGHALVQGRNNYHQQARTQYHTHGTGHGGGGQCQLLAGAGTDQFVVDGGAGSNNEDAGCAGVGGREGSDEQYDKAEQFR